MTNAEVRDAARAKWDLWAYRLKVIGLTIPIAAGVAAGGVKGVDLIVDAAEWRDAWVAEAKETNTSIQELKTAVAELPAIRKARDKEIADINTKLDRHSQAIDSLATGNNDIKAAIASQSLAIADGNSMINQLMLRLLEPPQHADTPTTLHPRVAGP